VNSCFVGCEQLFCTDVTKALELDPTHSEARKASVVRHPCTNPFFVSDLTLWYSFQRLPPLVEQEREKMKTEMFGTDPTLAEAGIRTYLWRGCRQATRAGGHVSQAVWSQHQQLPDATRPELRLIQPQLCARRCSRSQCHPDLRRYVCYW
jgi:hypothetical protein